MSTLELQPLKLNTMDIQRETAKIMGWKYSYYKGTFIINKPGEPNTMVYEWEPHKNFERDAVQIVKKFMMKMHFNGVKWIVYTDYTSAGLIQMEDESLPMAICLAIIEHREVGMKHG